MDLMHREQPPHRRPGQIFTSHLSDRIADRPFSTSKASPKVAMVPSRATFPCCSRVETRRDRRMPSPIPTKPTRIANAAVATRTAAKGTHAGYFLHDGGVWWPRHQPPTAASMGPEGPHQPHAPQLKNERRACRRINGDRSPILHSFIVWPWRR